MFVSFHVSFRWDVCGRGVGGTTSLLAAMYTFSGTTHWFHGHLKIAVGASTSHTYARLLISMCNIAYSSNIAIAVSQISYKPSDITTRKRTGLAIPCIFHCVLTFPELNSHLLKKVYLHTKYEVQPQYSFCLIMFTRFFRL